jgi:hypothetical protein
MRGLLVTTLIGLAAAASGCASVEDPEARARLDEHLGRTTMSVHPAFVRRGKANGHDDASAARLAAFLREEGLAEAEAVSARVPITGEWRRNQARMLEDSARQFAAFVGERPPETSYALLAEYLMGSEHAGGIHVYVVDRRGRIAFVALLNSHHDVFRDRSPRTVEECTEVLEELLRDLWKVRGPP